jgi:hypothetical protein
LTVKGLLSTDVMPVLFGHETAAYTARDLTMLRYASWQAIRGGRPPSPVMSIEVVLTHAVRGHRIDPVQYITTTLALTWMRFLTNSHSQQVERKLQTLHF